MSNADGTLSSVKAVVILGSASTVARAIAHVFARAGYQLVLADFDREENERIAQDVRVRFPVACHTLYFDAADYGSHEAFWESCRIQLGGWPEGVLLCFGYMPVQAEAQADFEKAKRAIDVNFTGAVSILERIAAVFETRQGGFIAALSSVAGDRGRQSNYIYGASKGALTVYLAGLRNRLHAAHVQVLTVKPGFMDTKMTYGLPLPGPLVAAPEQAAGDVFRAIQKSKDVVYVRFFWRYIMLIIRHIPEWQFKKMNI